MSGPVLFLVPFVLFVIGALLWASATRSWHLLGGGFLAGSVLGFCIVFLVQHGLPGLLEPVRLLEFLLLPIAWVVCVSVLPWVIHAPVRLKTYGVAWLVIVIAEGVLLNLFGVQW